MKQAYDVAVNASAPAAAAAAGWPAPIRAAIFDFDGTLIDSMKMWHTIPSSYARRMGKEPVLEFDQRAKYLSLDESAAELRRMYDLPFRNEEIIEQIMEMVYGFYREELPLKENARAVLQELQEKGIRMCIATMTPRRMILAAIDRLGIAEYFEEVYSCADYGIGKDTPDIYDMAAERMAAARQETLVFEDMVRAVRTARAAGYRVVGLYDAESEADWQEIQAHSEWSLRSLRDWPGLTAR